MQERKRHWEKNPLEELDGGKKGTVKE